MLIKVKVVARAKKERVEDFSGGIKVYVKEPAVEGKANKRLVEVLASHYGIRKKSISIVKGQACREKVIEILA